MPGYRDLMTWFMGAFLCLPIAAYAEEPSELLQLNEVGAIHLNETDSPITSFLNPQQSPHAGLLGKRYFGGAYVYGRNKDGMLPGDILKDAHGFSLSFNSPLLPGDGTKPFAMDVFAGYSKFFGSDTANMGFMSLDVDLSASEFEMGVTLYTESISRVRPFVQLGWIYTTTGVSFDTPPGAFEVSQHDSNLLLNVGSEFDLSNRFTLRTVLDIDTEEFDSSTVSGELIYTVSESVFFRMGAFTDLDASFYGAIVGGGVKF